MSNGGKVRYLKLDRGRYYYQRRVPTHLQGPLGLKFWRRPCGDVDYSKAVQLVVTWAEEHDATIARLSHPDRAVEMENTTARRIKSNLDSFHEFFWGFPPLLEMSEQRPGEQQFYPREKLPRPWQAAMVLLAEAEAIRAGEFNTDMVIRLIDHQVSQVERGEQTDQLDLPDYQPLTDYLDTKIDPEVRSKLNINIGGPVKPMSDLGFLDQLREAYDVGFGDGVEPPSDPDDRDEYEYVKRKLERKISELSPDPNTIAQVAERYYTFNSIRPLTRSKYRRDVGRLTQLCGDVPLDHVQADHLRALRDQLTTTMKPASVHAVFTPIKGLFGYAVHEEIIRHNPMSAVKLPKDPRPIEERKWKKFEPDEVARILASTDQIWGSPMPGLSNERRHAIRMVVRTLAFTGMRPIEVLRLTSDDVEDHLLRIRGSKTASSTRVIPLHHEIADLPSWIRGGGLKTFDTIKTDPVGSVRHNFERLVRKLMPQPILDPQKVLYSFRSSFVNAMRRAGADIQIQRAILGHKEAGAIRHYDDGPEFSIKNRWVQATDPRLAFTERSNPHEPRD